MCMFSRSHEWHTTACAISEKSLASYRFTGDTPEQWLTSFRQHRWDWKEAENLIQEQSEDDQGWV